MPYDVFISCGGDTSWAENLKDTLAKRSARLKQPITSYLYKDQHHGRSIPVELEAALSSSRVLVCIVNDSYLQSAHCLREYHVFSASPDRVTFQTYIIPVLAPGLSKWGAAEAQRAAFAQHETKLHNDIRQKYPDLVNDLLAAERPWHEMLESHRSVDLLNFNDVGPQSIPKKGALTTTVDKFIASVREHLNANGPLLFSDREVDGMSRIAGLSAFALGIDRYNEGGWGFSFGQRFEYDEDGVFLVKGRHEFNLLILRALRDFLPDEAIRGEVKATLDTAQFTKQTHIEVEDRIPNVSKYAAYLVARLRDDLLLSLGAMVQFATDLAQHSFAERWVLKEELDERGKTIRSDVVLFFEFLARLELESERDEAINYFLQNGTQDNAFNATQLKQLLGRIEDKLKAWYGENALFAIASATHKETPDQQIARWLRDFDRIFRLLVLYRLLASTKRGAFSIVRFSLILSEYEYTKDDALKQLDSIVLAAERALETAASFSEDAAPGGYEGQARLWTLVNLFSLLLSDLRYHLQNEVLEKYAQRLASVSKAFFCTDAAFPILLQADAATWASTILLARRLQFPLDRSWLASLWALGRELRSERINAVSRLGVNRLLEGAIQKWVSEHCRDFVRRPEGARLFKEGAEELTTVKWMQGASFWGRSPRRELFPGPEPKGSGTIGLLNVHLLSGDKEQVVFGSEGYNQLFLHAFSRLAGLSIFNLRGIVREIGSSDNILVYQMGSVVVDACYAPTTVNATNEMIWERCDFMDRTRLITEYMRAVDWNLERGAKDILRIRTGLNAQDFRVLLRCARVEKAQDDSSPRETEARMIAWTFLEITSELNLGADIDRFTLSVGL